MKKEEEEGLYEQKIQTESRVGLQGERSVGSVKR